MTSQTKLDTGASIQRLVGTADYLLRCYEVLLQDWQPDAPPPTLVFSALGRTFCVNGRSSPEAELTEIWNAIEELLVIGDETVKNAVATGFLEAVLSECSAGRFSLSSSSCHLGNETKAYCKAWDEFTGCKTAGVS